MKRLGLEGVAVGAPEEERETLLWFGDLRPAACEQALVEAEMERMTVDGRRLASRMIGRIAEIERESGADVAEAVVEGLIDLLRGKRRTLS